MSWDKGTPWKYPDVVEKFWGNTEDTPEGCVMWIGSVAAKRKERDVQYRAGRFEAQKNKIRHRWSAHRFAWMVTHRKKITPEDEIRHTCDNYQCVNPDHLAIGTRNDTIDAMMARGTTQTNNKNAAKLSWAKVRAIRAAYEAGSTQKDIVKDTKITKGNISMIINNKIWKEE
jgi:hypothetical protein